jgi:hypothetical protein
MTKTTIQSSVGSARQTRRERFGVFALGGLIVTVIGGYLALGVVTGSRDSDRGLLPYQVLVRTLPESEQRQFRVVRQGLIRAEAERAQTSRWPDPSALAAEGMAWARFQQGVTVNYLGQPADPARPAWLLTIQEPDPGALPDPAPNDDEHHRLPDGTTLHIYVWMHRYGGQVPVAFVPQPQNSGWIEVFTLPPNPVLPPRR